MNIAVLAGGFSNERNVSLSSGAMVTKTLRENGHNVALVDLFVGESNFNNMYDLYSRQIPKEWYFSASTPPDLRALKADNDSNSLVGPNVIKICESVDVVFLALHGGCGEDGHIQALLDMLGIKYTGAAYLSSGIAMNKDITKLIVKMAGVKTPEWDTYFIKDQKTIDNLINLINIPVVIKIPDSGSSVGVYIIRDKECLRQTLTINIGRRIIAEQFIEGREIQMAFLKDAPLPSIEIVPLQDFYTYDSKYVKGKAIETTPADIPSEIEEEMAKILMNVVRSVGITDYARADFIVDGNGEIWFIEINTLPGLTSTSLFPQEAAAKGISFNLLCESMIKMALNKKVGLERELIK